MIAAFDALALLGTVVSLLLLVFGWRRTLTRNLRWILVTLLTIWAFHGVSNLLEWTGITSALDPHEDYVELIGPLLWFLFCYVFLQERAAHAYRESEERFKALFENSPDAVFLADPATGVILGANPASARLVNQSREDLVGHHHSILYPPDAVERSEDMFRRHAAWAGMHGTAGPEEHIVISSDGTRVPVEITARYVPIGGRRVLQGVFRDIRARKRATEEAVRARRDWESIFRGIGHPTLVLDPQHTILSANQAALDLVGLDRGRVEGRRCYEVFHKTDAPPLRCLMEELRSDGQPRTAEMTLEVLGRVFLVSCTSVVDEDGRLEKVIHVSTDITERKRAEERLRISEQRYRTLFENAALGIYRTTPDGRILATNKTALRMLGFKTFADLAARNLEEGGYEPGYPRDEFKRMMERDGQVSGFESAWKRQDGSTMYVRESARAIRATNGRIVCYEGTLEDITAEREANRARDEIKAQLVQAQKLDSIGTLASGVAHEINNPLTGIINYGELIERREADPKLREYAAGVVREGNRVAEIVRSLLEFSRQENELLAPTSISDIIDSTLLLVETSLRHHGIRLVKKVSAAVPLVPCRSHRVQQVVLNLLINARDALNQRFPRSCDEKTIQLTVDTVLHDDVPWVVLAVEDNGVGIPTGVQNRIFDPFFTTKPRNQGTGLGLSISYGIVRDHGGVMRVESEENAYTRFTVELPVSPAQDGETLLAEEGRLSAWQES